VCATGETGPHPLTRARSLSAPQAGYVERVASQADGRRVGLRLTDAGRALAESARAVRQRAFAEAMDDWSDDDRRDFARLLTRFVGRDRTGDGRKRMSGRAHVALRDEHPDERMNSPLERHEVRLRGLRRTDPFHVRGMSPMAILPSPAQFAGEGPGVRVTQLKPRSASAASRDGAYRSPSGGFTRSGGGPATGCHSARSRVSDRVLLGLLIEGSRVGRPLPLTIGGSRG
jgi:hypothetical protein